MAVMDIHNVGQSITMSEASFETLAGWGKLTSSYLNITQTTQISKVDRGYLLLVDGMPVVVMLSDDQQTVSSKITSSTQPVAITERLDLIKDRLVLSITQLAELFGVTRKTVYDWYEGTEPRRNATSRMEILIDMLNGVSPEVDLARLKAVWNIPVSGKSFRTVFGDDNIDIETLQKALAEKLNELSTRMVATTSPIQKSTSQFGDSQLAEFDRRTDIG
jgi:DNA-binding transcriptional regulator YiaG